MPFFTKKPVTIEAIQWTGDNTLEIATFASGYVVYPFRADFLEINTLEGDMKCMLKDWVIKGIKGEFYPCKPAIFAMTYEEVK